MGIVANMQALAAQRNAEYNRQHPGVFITAAGKHFPVARNGTNYVYVNAYGDSNKVVPTEQYDGDQRIFVRPSVGGRRSRKARKTRKARR